VCGVVQPGTRVELRSPKLVTLEGDFGKAECDVQSPRMLTLFPRQPDGTLSAKSLLCACESEFPAWAVGGATHVRGTNWYEGENAFSMDGQPCGWNGEPYLADQTVAAASLVHGFLGLSYTPDDFHLDPHLPPGWNEMSAEIQVPRPPLPCHCAGQRPVDEGSHPSAIERIPMTTEQIPVTRIAPSPSEFICGVTFPNTSLSCGNSFRRVPEVLPLRAAN
jgi:hypothetical protein